jgi:anti-sigma factor RsiW
MTSDAEVTGRAPIDEVLNLTNPVSLVLETLRYGLSPCGVLGARTVVQLASLAGSVIVPGEVLVSAVPTTAAVVWRFSLDLVDRAGMTAPTTAMAMAPPNTVLSSGEEIRCEV